jgi:NAD(P)-dependent dehydrogenase (short-subunit alcohol dehydrogenase family)
VAIAFAREGADALLARLPDEEAVWTPLIPATMSEDQVASFGTGTPLGRPAQPAELAPSYAFLASQESSYTTGETIAVTGGTPIT